MLVLIVRILLLLVVLGLLIQQARRAPAQSRRQRSFWLAAGAMGLFLILAVLQLLGSSAYFTLLLPFLTLIVTLLTISVVLLYLAWRGGEMDEQINRARQTFEKEQTRRKQ